METEIANQSDESMSSITAAGLLSCRHRRTYLFHQALFFLVTRMSFDWQSLYFGVISILNIAPLAQLWLLMSLFTSRGKTLEN